MEKSSRNLVFSPSRLYLGLVSSRFAGFVRNREIYNLDMVSGPVLLKIKGTTYRQQNKTEQLNEIGENLVPGALNDTKTIRKASADIFANSGAEKPWTT